MRSLFCYALLALPLLGVAAEQPAPQPSDAANSLYANAQEAFQDLLNALPEESLQAALNSLTKFKAGVFESHRRGVEHVHASSPALATKLIVAAVQDLKKRQAPAASNGTTSAAPSQTPDAPSSSPAQSAAQDPTSSQPPASTDQPTTAADTPSATSSRPVVVPVEVTTTNTAGRTIIQTSEVLSEATASIAVTVVRTTTNAAGSTVALTTQETRPAVILTTTNAAGSTVTTTSAGNLAPTQGEVLTTTNEAGSTFLTTYTPGGGKVSSVKLVTTTDAQGHRTTLTSVIEVDPTDVAGAGTTAGGAGGASPTATGKPSVQSGAAARNGVAAVGIALGVAAGFF